MTRQHHSPKILYLNHTAKVSVQIAKAKDTKSVMVEADRTHLANVLNNLIDNAVKYSGDSVEITIMGDNKNLSVNDNGIGIPALPLAARWG